MTEIEIYREKMNQARSKGNWKALWKSLLDSASWTKCV